MVADLLDCDPIDATNTECDFDNLVQKKSAKDLFKALGPPKIPVEMAKDCANKLIATGQIKELTAMFP